MKKIITFNLLFLLIINCLVLYAFADNSVQVKIPVEVKNGGTLVMQAHDNSPVPNPESLELIDGQTGEFVIDFLHTGDYSYSIYIQKDDRDITFDSTIYNIKISVFSDNGSLKAYTVISNAQTNAKCSEARFDNKEIKNPDIKEKQHQEKTLKKPYTGDDYRLALYLLAALISAAGLFALSIIYYRSAIKKENSDN